LRVSEATGGAFDVTVGPLVNLWQFGPEQDDSLRPSDQELERVRDAIGYWLLEVRLDPPAVRKRHPECYIDLSAIAKGFGVDEIARLCQEHGLDAYLVEIGGEIRARGEKEPGLSWVVGIEAPQADRRALQRRIPLSNLSLATSGDYRNFRNVDGRRISHTIDPRTGRAVDHALASVTVLTDTCMEADALATALMVLGPEEAYDWTVEHKLAALLIIRGEEGRFVERPSPRFAELYRGEPPQAESDQRGDVTMTTVLLAILVFGGAIAAMAVGVMLGRRRLRGTCGGLANFKDSQGRPMCDACHDPSPTCAGVEEGKQRIAEESGSGSQSTGDRTEAESFETRPEGSSSR